METTAQHSWEDVSQWSEAWPLKLRGPRSSYVCDISFLSMTECKRLKCWIRKNKSGRYVTMATAYKRIVAENEAHDEPGHTYHHVVSICKSGHPEHRPVIVISHRDNVVLDGNHTLMALIHTRYRGKVMALRVRSRAQA